MWRREAQADSTDECVRGPQPNRIGRHNRPEMFNLAHAKNVSKSAAAREFYSGCRIHVRHHSCAALIKTLFMSLVLRLLLPLALLLPPFAGADYVLYKSRKGVLVASRGLGSNFSFDVPGNTITPADHETSPNPQLFADAFYLEIVPMPIKGNIPSNRNEELALLSREFDSTKAARKGPPTEIRSEPLHINDKTVALTWSFIPFGDTKRFYCLAFRSEKTLFLLKAGFAKAPTKDDPSKFLAAVGTSFF